jgi:hypothetical protein
MIIFEACRRDGSVERNSRMSTITYGSISAKGREDANKGAALVILLQRALSVLQQREN